MRRLTTLALATLAAALLVAATAHAFGTINIGAQSAEHEKITRAALWCKATHHPRDCFQTFTMGELAGGTGGFGAVGAPDADSTFDAEAHCDDSDYLPLNGYPQTRAEATQALMNCRYYAYSHLIKAGKAAKDLLDKHGRIDRWNTDLVRSACTFVGGVGGRAKCDVLDGLGRALHTTEDFYSHTNWVDEGDPDLPPDIDNPPGLSQAGLTSLFDWDALPVVPDGLTGGCFNFFHPSACRGRVTHDVVNKDEGTIDPITGRATAPTTVRGKIGTNFQKAVSGAMSEAQRQWDWLANRLVDLYGKRKGHLMICALTHDHPYEDCQVKVTVEGTEHVQWTTNDTMTGPCGGTVTGSGTTTVRFSSTRPVYASPMDLVPPEGAPDGTVGVQLPTDARFQSQGSVTSDGKGCASGDGGTPTPPDCGSKSASLPLLVVSQQEDRITLKTDAGASDPYKNCPNGVLPRTQIGPDDAELADDDLFDENVGEIVVVGHVPHRHIAYRGSTPTSTYDDEAVVTLDWTLNIEKAPKENASAARRRRW